MTDAALVARYGGRVPRYTSYPTAPQFSAARGAADYAGWLAALGPDVELSLYLHVPFCARLCLYCGCNTSVVRQERPIRAYAALLATELSRLADHIGGRPRVTSVHWGGGTPTTLPNDCLTGIMDHIRGRFFLAPAAEVAIELDPSHFSDKKFDALSLMGITRASLGVQDFAPMVQAAIGRVQSFAQTQACAQALRAIGIKALNLDLIYGLPHQTVESVVQTAHQALALQADRIAVFGYAHVPWIKRHQSLIPQAALPGAAARFAQRQAIADTLGGGGFMPIGLDHYALEDDPMAQAARARTLRRGFQGYSADAAPVLLGIGASAISSLPQGYVQNASAVPAYAAAIKAGDFATARGVSLTPDDRLRRVVIERIMCDLEVDLQKVAREQAADPEPLYANALQLEPFIRDGLLRRAGPRITVTPAGRAFVRNIAAVFDAYLPGNAGAARHACAI